VPRSNRTVSRQITDHAARSNTAVFSMCPAPSVSAAPATVAAARARAPRPPPNAPAIHPAHRTTSVAAASAGNRSRTSESGSIAVIARASSGVSGG